MMIKLIRGPPYIAAMSFSESYDETTEPPKSNLYTNWMIYWGFPCSQYTEATVTNIFSFEGGH